MRIKQALKKRQTGQQTIGLPTGYELKK